MAFGNEVTIVGNAVRDVELRFAASGTAIASLSIAYNSKRGDEEVTSFFDVTAFGTLAENAASSIERGTRVVVVGKLEQRSWEDNEGNKRSKIEILADEISPSLRWATAEVTKSERDDQRQQRSSNGNGRRPARSGGRSRRDDDDGSEPF